MKNISLISKIFVGTSIAIMAPALIVYAALNTLNGLSGMSQTLATTTDANIGLSIMSSGTTHTFSPGWSGVLAVSRGGTGNTAFTSGSIPFFNGTILAENNAKLWWDNSGSGTLNVGGGTGGLEVGYINSASDVVTKGQFQVWSETAGDQTAIGATDRTGQIFIGTFSEAILDTNSLIGGKLFVFPNKNGTFALLEGSASSTIRLGDIKSCIVMADSDGSGVGYVTINDGVLTATTTQPSNCQ